MSVEIFDYITSSPLSIVISILYVFFFHRLTNHITHLNDLQKRQRNLGWSSPRDQKENIEREREFLKDKITKAEYKRHLMLFSVGVIGIVISATLESSAASHGLSWGSVMTVVLAIFTQWHNYKETHRLFVLGGSLTGLVIFAIKMFSPLKTHSITQTPSNMGGYGGYLGDVV